MNSTQHCRLCASVISETQIFITDCMQNVHFLNKLDCCFQLKISNTDSLPKTICINCNINVNKTYETYLHIHKAQESLRDIYGVKSPETLEFLPLNKENYEPNYFQSSISIIEARNDKSITNLLPRKQFSKQTQLGNSGLTETNTERALLKTTSKVWNNYQWKCNECGEFKNSVDELRNHYTIVHLKTATYLCNECEKVFEKYESFKRHVRGHRNRPKYCCDLCGKNFLLKIQLDRHKETHIKILKYMCTKCGKSFKTSNSLHVHGRSHLPQEFKYSYECDICKKKFTTKPSLNCHIKIHIGIKEFTCDQCGKRFMQKGNLDYHLLTHSESSPHHCEQCPKTFKTVLRLKKHLLVHSELKPYKCETCGRAFRQKWTLTRHIKIHSNELPFECEYCHKFFRMKAFLKIHLRQHTGERPYSCLACDHHFTNSSNYIKHLRARH